MPITHGGTAPYAPPATVIEVIRRFRERGLTTPFTKEILERVGVPETLSQRTMQSFKLLDFIDADGNPTVEFASIARAPEAEYRERLGEFLISVYAEVINFADPAEDSYERIRDAFRGYNPQGQQERMVTLFLALLDYAGIDISTAAASRRPPTDRSLLKAGGKDTPARRGAMRSGKSNARTPATKKTGSKPPSDARDAALVAWFDTRPDPSVPWPPSQRDAFMKTLRAIIDGIYAEIAIIDEGNDSS